MTATRMTTIPAAVPLVLRRLRERAITARIVGAVVEADLPNGDTIVIRVSHRGPGSSMLLSVIDADGRTRRTEDCGAVAAGGVAAACREADYLYQLQLQQLDADVTA